MNRSFPSIVQINASPGGIPKLPLREGRIDFSHLEGDDWNDKRHHGSKDQALCLFSTELIEELKEEGFPLFPRALGENLTTEGIDYRKVRIGDVWDVGGQASIRITKVRVPCRTIMVYGEGIVDAVYDLNVKKGNVHAAKWGRSGFFAEVIRPGIVHPGDPIAVHHQ